MAKENENQYSNDEEVVGEPEQFLDDDEHADTHAEHQVKVRVGEEDADVYTEEGRDELEESDEIAPWEEGFSEGAQGPESGVCAHCAKPLGDRNEGTVEREIKGDLLLFCSEKCAGAGPKSK